MFTEWDEWDQILLRNSTSRIKKLFKSYYNSADYNDGSSLSDFLNSFRIKKLFKSYYNSADYNDGSSLSDFLNSLRLLPGALAFQRLLVPWWMKGRLRTNPFNANDELCENDDL
jgi:hypothetical protein